MEGGSVGVGFLKDAYGEGLVSRGLYFVLISDI